MVFETKNEEQIPVQASSEPLNWKSIAVLALFCILVYFVGLGSFGLIDRSEAYYGEGAREMFESGKYLIPQLNYVAFYDKPILMYWFQILSYSVFGVNEFAARFSTAFFASALIFSTYFFGKRIVTDITGLRAALILGSSPMFIALGRQCLTDMTFSVFIVGALFCIMAKLSGAKRWLGAAGYFCLALAILTKGPIAVVLFGSVIGIHVLAVCRSASAFFDYLRKLDIGVGLIILSVVATPWYVIAARETNGFWTDIFFIKGNLARVSGNVGHSHPQLWFYLPVLAYGFFPWIAFLPDSVYRSISLVRKNWKVQLPAIPESPVRVFLWCWLIGMLIVLSLPKAKLQTYILPMLPALSLLIACTMSDSLEQWKESLKVARHVKILSILFGLMGATMIGAGCAVAVLLGRPELGDQLPFAIGAKIVTVSANGNLNSMIAIVVGAIICGAGLLWQCERTFKNHLASSFNIIVGSVVGLALVFSQAGYCLIYGMVGANLHKAIVPLETRSDAEVAIFKEFKPSLMFYLKRPISTFDQARDLFVSDSTKKLYIVLKTECYPLIAKRGGKTVTLSKNEDWMVVEKSGVVLNKLPTLDEVLTQGNPTLNVEMMTLPLTGGVKH